MCGIFSILEFRKNSSAVDVKQHLVKKLKKLENRGSDATGIYVVGGNKSIYARSLGCTKNLKMLIPNESNNVLENIIGLGHTRWATHGDRNDNKNTQPMLSNVDGDFCITLNGCITNLSEVQDYLYNEEKKQMKENDYIQKKLIKEYESRDSIKNYKNLVTETDTEVIARLFYIYYLKDNKLTFENITKKVINKLKGQFAINIISKHFPNTIIAYSNETPIYIGLLDEDPQFIKEEYNKQECYIYNLKNEIKYIEISSETNALSENIKKMYRLKDKEIAICNENKIIIILSNGKNMNFINKKKIKKKSENEIKDRMEFEINEQVETLKRLIKSRITDKNELNFPEIENLNKKDIEKLKKCDSFYFVGCGTSYHACKVGAYIFSHMLKKRTYEIIATYSSDKKQIFKNSDVVFFPSQSGETRDTMNVLKDAKAENALCIIITNKINSSMVENGDVGIDVMAGEELSVASTKAYTSQYLTFVMFALYLKSKLEKNNDKVIKEIINHILELPNMVKQTLNLNVEKFTNIIKERKNFFLTSRGLDVATSEEGALKITEVSYINTRAISLGEFKHGNLALVNNEMNLLVIANESCWDTINIGINQILTSGCKPLIITNKSMEKNFSDKSKYKGIIIVPDTHELLLGLLFVIPLQKISHDLAISKNYNPDRPRNLAKAVTVQ